MLDYMANREIRFTGRIKVANQLTFGYREYSKPSKWAQLNQKGL
jgi:hypothetical protein